ncbi:MAG: hypothetical protein FJ213_04185 [Ignavibacteria bacterium]|nr:hypothetical protein [Ignavibacteria bacterium]
MKLLKIFFPILFSVIITGCAGCPYSFTGASLPPEMKTIAIPIFEDLSGFGEAGLREKITEELRRKFTDDNTLKISDRKIADTILDGAILSVRDEPSVITGTERVSTRRVTVSVKASFTDLKARKKIWEKNFSQWGDYDATSGGIVSRQIGFQTAIEKLTEDILIATVSDW